MRGWRAGLIAAAVGVISFVPAVVAAPSNTADAAATYWYAGSISEHTNFGGAVQTINFVQYGYCDGQGYYVDLNKLNGDWDARISSIYSSLNPNGCNRVTLYCKNGTRPTWYASTMYYSGGRGVNVPANCNDSGDGIRWWRG